MKKIYLILSIIVLIPIGLMAQNDIIFTYDANGNRVTREINMKKSSVAEIDTINYDEEQLKEKNSFVNDLGDSKITFFPNPVQQWLQIEVTGNQPVVFGQYTLIGNNGKEIFRGDLENTHRIDFRDSPPGLYILRIEIDGKKQTWKIIKD